MEIGFGSRLEQRGTNAGNPQTKVYLMRGPTADPANLSQRSPLDAKFSESPFALQSDRVL
jgi:hypothetical protein